MHKSYEKKRNSERPEPLAIIGIGCRFPGETDSPVAFWELLRNGADAIVDVPGDRWDIRRFYDPDPGKPGRMYVRQGGFLNRKIDLFDADFFNVSPREGESMDPQQRLLLEVAWEAMEDAGLDAAKLRGTDTGVYIGAFTLDHKVLRFDSSNRHQINAHLPAGSTMGILANRISYFFDFHGPSITLDTACSSSLVALHHACQSLWREDSAMVLCGGVNLMFKPEYTIAMCKGRFLSPDGRCKTFDKTADGYGRGEGAGIIVLKPLSKALDDGNPVYALVRATAVNHDGRTSGIAFPNQTAQEALLRKVYGQAGISPSEVQYVEAHGTGTLAGDIAEAGALGGILGPDRDDGGALVVGSVKTNIGHLEAAAGIAGVIKTALCLKNKQIPGNLHFNTPNPEIPFEELRIRVPRTTEPWPAVDGPAIAGVNSFGYGGANAHAVLEEPPRTSNDTVKPGEERENRELLIPISAASKEALRELVERYIDLFTTEKDGESVTLRDIAFSAGVRRSHHDHRLAVIARSMDDFIEKLKQFAGGVRTESTLYKRAVSNKEHKIVFVFSGMGPQWWCMGRELFLTEPVFLKAAEECDVIFKKLSGWSLLEEFMKDEAASRMHETDVAQPANFVLQTALTALWRSWGIEPDAVVGHSTGEAAAACISGALNLEDSLKVCYNRSRLQQTRAGGGKMLAAALSPGSAQRYLNGEEDDVSIAAVNGPGSVTLSGNPSALEKIAAKLEEEDIFNRFTGVDIAYHSCQMDPLEQELSDSLRTIRASAPRIPLYSTVTGKRAENAEWGPAYWWKNVRQPVLFYDAINTIVRDGYFTFLEIGPHPVLSNYIFECLLQRETRGNALSSQHRKKPQREALLSALGRLYINGYPVPWEKIHPPRSARYIPLPAYPWQRESMFLETEASREDRLGHSGHALLGVRLKSPRPAWEIELNSMYAPYLKDHVVLGSVLFPGAGYVEVGLALDRERRDESHTVIESLAFYSPLTVNELQDPLLHVDYDPDTGSYEVYSTLAHDRSSWILRASGKIRREFAGNRRKNINIGLLQKRCRQEIDMERFYRELFKMGLQYGPQFRILKSLRVNKGEVLLELEPPEFSFGEDSDYRLHPVVLDACFQAMLSGLDPAKHEARSVYLPVGIERIQFFRKPGRKVFAYGFIKKQTKAVAEWDIVLFDEAGAVLAEVERFRCKALPATASDEKPQLDKRLYESTWKEVQFSLAEPVPENITGTWFIFSNDTGAVERMEEPAASRGIRVVSVTAGNMFREVSPNHVQVRGDSMEDILHLFESAKGCRGIIYLCDFTQIESSEAIEPSVESGVKNCIAITRLVQCLARNKDGLDDSFRLHLLTSDAQAVLPEDLVSGVADSTAWGLGRVIMNEHPELHCRLTDLDAAQSVENTGEILTHLIFDDRDEEEKAFRDGKCYVHRLIRTVVVEEKAVPRTVALAADSDSGVAHVLTGIDGAETPRFREVRRRKPGPGEVEVSVDSIAVDPKNPMKPRTSFSNDGANDKHESPYRECSGSVVKTGEGVKGFKRGDEVEIIYRGDFSSFLTLPVSAAYITPRRRIFNMDEAPRLISFLSAYYALHDVARLRRGESIFINSTTGGTALAAIQYAQSVGAMVFAAADGAEQYNYLRSAGIEYVTNSRRVKFADEIMRWTDGKGVDVVLNFFPGEVFHKSFSVLAPFARFADMCSGNGFDSRVDFSGSVRDNFTYTSINMQKILADRRGLVEELLAKVGSWFDEGRFSPLPARVFPAGEALEAFQSSSTDESFAGVSLVKLKRQEVTVVPFKEKKELFRSKATYLVTGGLGGFGLESALWMVEKGARRLALAGRSGASRGEAREALACMKSMGVDAKVIKGDVSDPAEVEEIIKKIKATMPPLKGIFHSAMVLDDGYLINADREQFERVMGPKALGAWNLHKYTMDLELDYFVLFSSVSSLAGNPGQGSYAAANAYLDGLARFRRSRNLPALSVNWGLISRVGIAAGNPKLIQLLGNMGVKGLAPEQAFEALEFLLRRNTNRAMAADINWRKWRELNPHRVKRSIFSVLASEAGENETRADIFREKLEPLNSVERHELIQSLLAEKVGETLNISQKKLDNLKSFSALGIDSLIATDIMVFIRYSFDVQYNLMNILNAPSISELGSDILDKI